MSEDELRALHKDIMRAIVRQVSDTPLVLKGGTGLMFAHGLPRFSEDLDFDSPKKLNLETKIRDALKHIALVDGFKNTKDTDTVTRYRLQYSGQGKRAHLSGYLKIEISHRIATIDPNAYLVHDGMCIATVGTIITHKMSAAITGDNPRTAARDLFDLAFLAQHHTRAFDVEQWDELSAFVGDPQAVIERYQPAFLDDPLLVDQNAEDIVLSLMLSVEAARGAE